MTVILQCTEDYIQIVWINLNRQGYCSEAKAYLLFVEMRSVDTRCSHVKFQLNDFIHVCGIFNKYDREVVFSRRSSESL